MDVEGRSQHSGRARNIERRPINPSLINAKPSHSDARETTGENNYGVNPGCPPEPNYFNSHHVLADGAILS